MPVLHPTLKSRMPRLVFMLSATLFASQAIAGPEEDKRASDAVRVLSEIQKIPEQGIPDKLLDEGRAIVVLPDTLKVGLVLGGRRGHGLMSVKGADGTWSQPVFVKLTGGSIGFQAGVQSSDVVLVFRNDRNLENIVNGKFTLGADAGVALDGAVLQIDDAANMAVYGSAATPRAIFEGRAGAPSSAVVGFRDQLEESTMAARAARSQGNTPVAAPVTVTAPATPAAASTTPVTTTAPAQTAPTQGFQPVAEGEVRTETLDGGKP